MLWALHGLVVRTPVAAALRGNTGRLLLGERPHGVDMPRRAGFGRGGPGGCFCAPPLAAWAGPGPGLSGPRPLPRRLRVRAALAGGGAARRAIRARRRMPRGQGAALWMATWVLKPPPFGLGAELSVALAAAAQRQRRPSRCFTWRHHHPEGHR